MATTTDNLLRKIDDVYNRMISTEVYLDKYAPYNNFVQYCELLHVALEGKQLKKLESYENTKLQIFLAEILLDMGRQNPAFDKKKAGIPPEDYSKSKPHDCECNLKDFKHILNRQVKLSNRNQKIIKKVQDRRRILFKDQIARSPEEILKQNNCFLRTYI